MSDTFRKDVDAHHIRHLHDVATTSTDVNERIHANNELEVAMDKLDAPLPPQVERTCEIFIRQFSKTADRLDATADRLQKMCDDLREKAKNIRAASQSVPQDIRDWVLTERSYNADAAFFEPIIR